LDWMKLVKADGSQPEDVAVSVIAIVNNTSVSKVVIDVIP